MRFRALAVVLAAALPLLVVTPEVGPTVAIAAERPAPAAPSVPAETGGVTAMSCPEGGTAVDINHASTGDVSRGLGVSAPIAERVVDHRPYLHALELGAVPGIGPAVLARIVREGRACATPAALPPPAPDPCVHPQQVDLNDAGDLADAADLFGRPTAERIYHGGYGLYLSVRNARRVPGVGPGLLERLGDRVCAEPTPVEHAGVRWTFVDADGGRGELETSAGSFALTVPPGVVSDEGGAWTSVDQREDPFAIDAPAADFHIHGEWSGYVHATLPADTAPGVPYDADQWTNVVVHYPSGSTDFNEADVHSGPDVALATDGSLTVAVDHLSILSGIKVPLRWAATQIVKGRQLVDRLWRAVLGTGGAPPRCQPDISDSQFTGARTFPDGRVIDTSGDRVDALLPSPSFWYCVEERAGDTERWRLVNNRAVAYDVREDASADVVEVGTGGPVLSALAYFLHNRAAVNDGPGGRSPVSVPGSDINLDVAPDGGEVGLAPNVAQTLAYAALSEVSAVIPMQFGDVGGRIWNILVDCPAGLIVRGADAEDGAAAFELGVGFARSVAGCLDPLLTPSEKLHIGLSGGPGKLLARAKRATLWLKAGTAASYVVDLVTESAFHDDVVTFTNRPAPPAPRPGSGGAPLPGGGLDGTLPAGPLTDIVVKRNGYHAELTYGGDFVGRAILSQSDYACITRRYLVRDRVRPEDYGTYVRQNSATPATCNSSLEDVVLSPGSRNFIMRELTGTAWLLDADGTVRWIESGGVYDCLAQRMFVIDNRSWAEITAFPWAPDGQHASCP